MVCGVEKEEHPFCIICDEGKNHIGTGLSHPWTEDMQVEMEKAFGV